MKKAYLEQALDGVDSLYLEEAAAYTPAKVHRPLWQRGALIAACLAAVLAISAAAGLLGDWSFYFGTEPDGTKMAWTEVAHGAADFPEATKEIIREAVAGVDEDTYPKATLTFDSLAEMEAFLGVDLLESTLYPVNPNKKIYCDLDYRSGERLVSGKVVPYENFYIHGGYALDKGDFNNWMKFHMSTYAGASLAIGSEAEKGLQFQEYELQQLGLVAGVLTGVMEGRHTDVYILKDCVAYDIMCTQDSALPADFLDSLY